MRVHIRDNKIVITIELKTFEFDLPKAAEKNLNYKIDFIIKHNEFLAEHKIKNEISRLLFQYKHENDIHQNEKQLNQ